MLPGVALGVQNAARLALFGAVGYKTPQHAFSVVGSNVVMKYLCRERTNASAYVLQEVGQRMEKFMEGRVEMHGGVPC